MNNLKGNNLADIKCPACSSNSAIKIMPYKDKHFLSCSSLYQCNNCDLVYASILPLDEELSNYYNNGVYYSKNKVVADINFIRFSEKLALSRINLLSENIDLNKINKILDVGAGNAIFGRELQIKYKKLLYDVVEPDEEIKRNYGKWVNDKYKILEEVANTKYSIIILNQILEHVNNPRKFISDLSMLLELNSYLYIDVPFSDYLFKSSIEPHILFWNKKSLIKLLNNLGFDIIFIDTCGMSFRQAKLFFSTNIYRFIDPWNYVLKINSILSICGIKKQFNTFQRFNTDKYGGRRQWLRCIAIKNKNWGLTN